MSLDMLWAQVEECILNKTKVCWLIGALSDENRQVTYTARKCPTRNSRYELSGCLL